MITNTHAKKMQIFISSTDKFKNEPLHEVIVYAARNHSLAGATVVKGYMGYGASSMITNFRYWEISEKIPMLVQIIDEPEKIEKFIDIVLPFFEKVEKGCLITVEDVEIILNKSGTKNP